MTGGADRNRTEAFMDTIQMDRMSEEPRPQGGASSFEKALYAWGLTPPNTHRPFIPVHSTGYSGFFT